MTSRYLTSGWTDPSLTLSKELNDSFEAEFSKSRLTKDEKVVLLNGLVNALDLYQKNHTIEAVDLKQLRKDYQDLHDHFLRANKILKRIPPELELMLDGGLVRASGDPKWSEQKIDGQLMSNFRLLTEWMEKAAEEPHRAITSAPLPRGGHTKEYDLPLTTLVSHLSYHFRTRKISSDSKSLSFRYIKFFLERVINTTRPSAKTWLNNYLATTPPKSSKN